MTEPGRYRCIPRHKDASVWYVEVTKIEEEWNEGEATVWVTYRFNSAENETRLREGEFSRNYERVEVSND